MRLRTFVKYGLLIAILLVAGAALLLTRQDFDRFRPLIAEKVKEVTGRDFEIAGSLRLDLGLMPAIVVEDVRLQNAVFGTRAEMMKARKLEAEVALWPLLLGRIEIVRLALIGPDILLETDERGRSNWDFSRDDEPPYNGRPASAEQAALELPHLGAVSIENGLLTYRNGMTGTITKIAVARFDGASDSANEPLEVSLNGSYDGTPFRVSGRLGAFATLGSPGAFPVDLNGELGELQLAVKGTVNRPLSPTSSKISVQVNGSNLKMLSNLLKVPLPNGPLVFSSQVTTEGGTISLSDIKVKLAESDVQGSARWAPAAAAPARPGQANPRAARGLLTASLVSRHFDLGNFALPDGPPENGSQNGGQNGSQNGAKPKPSAKQPDTADGRLFSDVPLSLDRLPPIDLALDAKVEHLVGGPMTLSKASWSAKLKDGVLTLAPFSGVMADGTLLGNVTFDAARGGAVKADLRISGLDVSTLSRAFDGGDILSGKVEGNIELAGRGGSLRAIMASLDGKASIVMGPGHVKSSYVEWLGADLLRLAASAGAADTTQVNCLVGQFDLVKGLAASRAILFDTPNMTVKGEGSIDLGAERYNLKFTPRPKDVSLLNLATPWRVDGPLRRPQVSVDEMGVATRAAGALLAIVNPLALLVPMVSTGTGDRNPCVAALETAQQTAPAGKPPAQPANRNSGGIRGLIDSVTSGR